MSDFIPPDVSSSIKAIQTNQLDGLIELFVEKLGYKFIDEEQEIPYQKWDLKDYDKSLVRTHIKDLRRIAYHRNFYIIFCQIDRFTKYLERNIGKKLIQDYNYCLIVFSDENFDEYHFINIRYNEKTEKRNIFRRLILDDFQKIYTINQRLGQIALYDINGEFREDFNSDAELMHIHDKAFDVQAVTEEFFNEYKKILTDLRDYFIKQKKGDKNQCHEAAQQLLNRLMFLYFIQKKKWLDNNTRYIYSLFRYYKKIKQDSKNFYEDFLQPLFFYSFNNKHDYSEFKLPNDIEKEYSQMPYLNGGLFLQNELDDLGFIISDDRFEKIFTDLLEKYNFTIREDSPTDQIIAIDPEMLGKVYESLLLEEERGQSGIFYTPRIEIDFMCRQSLFHYLKINSEIDEKSLLKIIYSQDFIPKKDKNIEKLRITLENIKIADPACGSGSFLIGMLNVLYEIIRKVYFVLDIDITKTKILKNIIFSSLYGVDIKKWAIEVAKLRIWLKLIIDMDLYDLNPTEPILPNFYYKLKQGDSLTQLIGDEFYILPNNLFSSTNFSKQQESIISNLIELKKKYFYHEKELEFSDLNLKIREDTNKLYEFLIQFKINIIKKSIQELKQTQRLIVDSGIKTLDDKKKKEKRKKLDNELKEMTKLLDNVKSPDFIFFLWEYDFLEVFINGGFDIIIGNPPYIRHEDIKPYGVDSESIIKKYKIKLIELAKKKWKKSIYPGYKIAIEKKSDYLIYFYYFSFANLKKNGILCFITSNSWLDVKYGVKFQEFILKNLEILEIVDNTKIKSFKQADVNTIISIFLNSKILNNVLTNTTKFITFKESFEDVVDYTTLKQIYFEKNNIRKPLFNLKHFTQIKLLKMGAEMKDNEKVQIQLENKIKKFKYIGYQWSIELRAPEIYEKIIEKGKFKPLALFGNFETYLNTGGADKFYFIKEINRQLNKKDATQQDVEIENIEFNERFTIESDYIIPCIKSSRELSKILINEEDIKSRMLRIEENEDIYSKKVLDYVKYGEKKGYCKRSGPSKRSPWWKLPKQAFSGSEILFPRNFDVKICIFYNPFLYISNRFYRFNIPNHKKFILYLNSTVNIMMMEIYGRKNLGGGALDLEIPELKRIPVIDPSDLEFDVACEEVNSFLSREMLPIFQEIGINPDIEIRSQEPLPLKDRFYIDSIIFKNIGLNETEIQEFYWVVCELVLSRVNKAQL